MSKSSGTCHPMLQKHETNFIFLQIERLFPTTLPPDSGGDKDEHFRELTIASQVSVIIKDVLSPAAKNLNVVINLFFSDIGSLDLVLCFEFCVQSFSVNIQNSLVIFKFTYVKKLCKLYSVFSFKLS